MASTKQATGLQVPTLMALSTSQLMLHLPIELRHRGECQKNRKSPIIDHPNAREGGLGGRGLLIGTVQGQLGRRRHGGCLVQDLHLAICQRELGLAEN